MDPLETMKSEKIHLTLTLGEIDALHKAGFAIADKLGREDRQELEGAMQKLDEAVND